MCTKYWLTACSSLPRKKWLGELTTLPWPMTKAVDLGRKAAKQTNKSIVVGQVCTQKIFFKFLNQNICCGYSKEPSQCDGTHVKTDEYGVRKY